MYCGIRADRVSQRDHGFRLFPGISADVDQQVLVLHLRILQQVVRDHADTFHLAANFPAVLHRFVDNLHRRAYIQRGPYAAGLLHVDQAVVIHVGDTEADLVHMAQQQYSAGRAGIHHTDGIPHRVHPLFVGKLFSKGQGLFLIGLLIAADGHRIQQFFQKLSVHLFSSVPKPAAAAGSISLCQKALSSSVS